MLDLTESNEYFIWKCGDVWSEDFGNVAVREYLDEQGRYCLHVASPFTGPEKGQVYFYDVLVLDVEIGEYGDPSIFTIKYL